MHVSAPKYSSFSKKKRKKKRHLPLNCTLSTKQQLFLVSPNRRRMSHDSAVEPFLLYFTNICSREKNVPFVTPADCILCARSLIVRGETSAKRRDTKDLDKQRHTDGAGSRQHKLCHDTQIPRAASLPPGCSQLKLLIRWVKCCHH